MAWIPVAAWIAAVVLAAVVLGFCSYEVWWKSQRLRRDVAGLQASAEQLQRLGASMREARARLERARSSAQSEDAGP